MGRRSSLLVLLAVTVAFALAWRLGFYTAPGSSDLSGTSSPASSSSQERPGPSASIASRDVPPSQPLPGGSAPAAPAATSDSGVQPASPAETASSETLGRAKAAVDAAVPPSFDIVRVEPDGSAVIAGRAAPNQTVSVMNGPVSFGETRSNANGEFAMDLSLPIGEHRLRLAQADQNQLQTSLSDEAAIVSVPQTGRANELLVMVERPGQPAEVLVRPSPAEPTVASRPSAPVAAAAGSASAQPDQVSPGRPVTASPSDPQSAALEPKTSAVSDPLASSDDGTARSRVAAPTAAGALAVEAVEIENGKLFVAGAADSKSSVRVYLDDIFVTEAKGGAGDRFIASVTTDVPVGDHLIRADELGADGRVIARVEVPFNRPDMSSMAAIASAKNPVNPPQASGASSPLRGVLADAKPAVSEPQPTAELYPGGEKAASFAAASPTLDQPSERIDAAPLSQTDLALRLDDSGDLQASSQAGEPKTALQTDLPTVVQAPLEAVQSRVIIRRGDTLWRISRQTYGLGSRYTVIYLANGDQIRDPNRIYPGQVFRMPDDEAGSAPRG